MNLSETGASRSERRAVRANGIDIHYVESGAGAPLLLLHGGVVSTSEIWTGHPLAYVSHLSRLAEDFRVIAPDTRGCGMTTHSGGTVTFDQLADDVVALIEALGLERSMLCGFSEGATTATIVALRHPAAVRAVVNDAGYDVFDPQARTFQVMRSMLGGSPEAIRADPDAAARSFDTSPHARAMFEMMKRDQDGSQGEGHWKAYLGMAFERTTRSPGYTFDDLASIVAPTLLIVGDRDAFCSVEDGVAAYRKLRDGELAVLPNVGHEIPPAAIDATVDFLRRKAT